MAKRKEPAVISLAVITAALEDEASHVPVETTLARPAVNIAEATALQLSYRSAYTLSMSPHGGIGCFLHSMLYRPRNCAHARFGSEMQVY